MPFSRSSRLPPWAGGPLGSIKMPATVLAETLIIAALIGLFSAILPAQSAARRNIVDALRTVA